MNEFELRLESDLRRLLNPIVATPAPARGRWADRRRTGGARLELPMRRITLVAIPIEAATR
jgi:hypothetical protein